MFSYEAKHVFEAKYLASLSSWKWIIKIKAMSCKPRYKLQTLL